MNLIKTLFSSKQQATYTYEDFWLWFTKNQLQFYKTIKNGNDIDKLFFSKLSEQLGQLKEGFWFLCGMQNDTVAELILTADGNIKNMVFVEELVAAAPTLKNWKFTALKQPSSINDFGITMDGYTFDQTTLGFYPTEHPTMPDEIDITITHPKLNLINRNTIYSGVYLALDNFLGELRFATIVDDLNIINTLHATQTPIPITKLKDYLIWREKEFIEKYEVEKIYKEHNNYVAVEGTVADGDSFFAVINANFMQWEDKAQYPWIVLVSIDYAGEQNNGMPTENTYNLMNKLEDALTNLLPNHEGYLNIVRETGNSVCRLYFACSDFRKPAKAMYQIQQQFYMLNIDFDMYKDKYWQTFNKFIAEAS